jgi:EAL domain-containing protein (putative c-di-GMP-specific phosphodiesterase class I)
LSRAVAHDELRLAYQPIVDLESERLVGVEALLRWDHPEHGPVPPAALIEFAEQSDLIVSVGRWVLDRVARQAQMWRSVYPHAPIYTAVNLSGRHLAVAELPKHVAQVLEQHRLAPDALAIEITETSLISDIASSGQRLLALKALGLRLAIDDFGTGYSSLAYVRDLPVDVIKIDRSFIDRLPDNDREAMVAGVVTLAHSLGKSALAEGVECAEQARILRKLGCDYAQGFYFGPAGDPHEIDEHLAALAEPVPPTTSRTRRSTTTRAPSTRSA